MKLPAAAWQQREGMAELLDALDAAGGSTRFVGGCVRDTWLGLPVSDIDLATRLEPEEVVRRLQAARIKAVPTGIAHGTVTAVSRGLVVEVTTLRRDVATDGRRATIAYTDDWREDAARRDFTINALTADPVTLEVFDPFGGIADLEQGLVRFIGDPLTRIAEDHLRILRFFRFFARFGGDVADEGAIAACTARANDLMALSRERIADELLKLLSLPSPTRAIRLMIDCNILKPVLPEIGGDAPARLETLIGREAQVGAGPDALRRLAALLPPDPALATAVGHRLRLSTKAARRLTAVAAREQIAEESAAALAYRIGVEAATDSVLLGAGDPSACVALATWQRPRLLVGGGDLIAMGLTAGPIVAETLRKVEQDWVEAGFPEDRDIQRRIAHRHVDQALRERQ